MKKLSILVLTLCLAASLCGCGGNKGKGGAEARQKDDEIAVGIAQDLTGSLDPYQMSTAGTRELLFNVFEGLYKPDKEGNYVPALAAESSVSEEGRKYTFKLRSGVKFHNGAELTGSDVIYSFITCKETTVNSNVKAALENMVGITASGSTVEVSLEKADSDFLAYVSSVYIVPKGYTQQDTQPVGTGPFKYVSRKVQENLVLERFDDYWGTKAGVKKVTLKIYETETALMTAISSGAVDLVAHLTWAQVSGLDKAYSYVEGSMNLVQALYLNHAEKPFDDVRVRQALCYAVDVPAMLQLTAEGHGSRLGSSIYPAFGKYFDSSLVEAYPHDAEKAKALLKEAGYPNGFDLTITVPSNYTPHVDTAVVLAEQLKAVGINASVQEVEWNTWLTDVYQGRKFQATVSGMDASTLTAGALLNRWVSDSGKNFCNVKESAYDGLIAQASAMTDDGQRTDLYKQAAKLLSDTAAHVYTQDLADFVAIRGTLTGYQNYPLYVMDLSTLSYQK